MYSNIPKDHSSQKSLGFCRRLCILDSDVGVRFHADVSDELWEYSMVFFVGACAWGIAVSCDDEKDCQNLSKDFFAYQEKKREKS